MSILAVGSMALDTIKTPQKTAKEILGGSVTYFSISASFFNKVNLIAVVGADFPKRYLEYFKKRSIDLRGLEVANGKTFRWKGEYGWDYGDPKTLFTCLNVFSKFNPRIPKAYKKSKYLFLANIDPQIQEKALHQLRPKLIACDTMNYWIKNKRKQLVKILKKIDIFLLNESEARLLTYQSSIVKAAKELLKLGPKIVIIKKGEHGSLLFAHKYMFSIPAFLLQSIVDPTGAGDSFAGGVVGYLAQCDKLNQENLKRAVAYGAVMASFAAEDFSVKRLLSIGPRDIRDRFKEFQRLSSF